MLDNNKNNMIVEFFIYYERNKQKKLIGSNTNKLIEIDKN